MKVKYLLLKGVCPSQRMMSLSHEAANSLMPGASVKEVNNFFNERRSDEKLISYVEKHGEDAFLDRQIPEIVEVEEDENFTHKIDVAWDSYDDDSYETLEKMPIIRKELLIGKNPEEIIQYLQDIGISFVEG